MKQYIKGTITFQSGNSIQYSSSDISGDVSISSQCVCSQGFSLGGVCAAELNMTLIISGVNRYDMLGAVIDVKTSYNGTDWENIGKFNVVSAQRYYNDITVTAYDNMIWLDKSAYSTDENSKIVNLIAEYLKTQRTIYQALKYIVETAGGLQLAHTQAEIEAMPNGTLSTIVFQDIQTNCPRDWLAWCAEFLGGFAYADENGKIAIKQFEQQPSITIQKSEIQADTADIADFTLKLASVSIVSFDGGSGSVYNSANDGKPNSIYIDLSDNWIVQGKNYLELNSMDVLGNVYGAVKNVPYRPFQGTVHINSILKTGQCIQIQDNDGDFYSSVITHHTWTLNGGQQIKCAGEDTRLLADTKSRTALKRQSEKIETMIKNIGRDVTQSELDQLVTDGKIVDGQTYYVYEE